MRRPTSFFRRSDNTFLARPRLRWNSLNRRVPKNASRTIRSDHHSPMLSSERAMGHVASSRLFRLMGPPFAP
jgi:hypothetical protein